MRISTSLHRSTKSFMQILPSLQGSPPSYPETHRPTARFAVGYIFKLGQVYTLNRPSNERTARSVVRWSRLEENREAEEMGSIKRKDIIMEGLSRRQFLTGAALATAGGALALGGCAPSGEASNAGGALPEGAGVATVGTGMGKHGTIQVEVVTKSGAIERIDVLESRESLGLGRRVLRQARQTHRGQSDAQCGYGDGSVAFEHGLPQRRCGSA